VDISSIIKESAFRLGVLAGREEAQVLLLNLLLEREDSGLGLKGGLELAREFSRRLTKKPYPQTPAS